MWSVYWRWWCEEKLKIEKKSTFAKKIESCQIAQIRTLHLIPWYQYRADVVPQKYGEIANGIARQNVEVPVLLVVPVALQELW